VWAAITATVAKNGLLVLWKLVVFMGGFYLSLMILWGILVMVGFIVSIRSSQRQIEVDEERAA